MRRRYLAASILAVGFAASACAGDEQVAAPSQPAGPVPQVVAPAPGTCIDYNTLYNQVSALFLNGSPDQNAGLGKLNNLKHQIDIGDFTAAKNQAFNLVSFILKKYQQGSLVASASDVITAVNNIFCFAGLSITLNNPTNAWLVYPTDLAQTLITDDGWAGTSLPGGVVDEPTLITITRLPDGFQLPTVLDQYPLFYQFEKESEHDHPFLASVVVGVCAANGIASDVLARLRLGHGLSNTTSEITPPADASFLNCANAPSLASISTEVLPSWLRGLGEFFLPKPVYAFRAGGGIGGSAGDYSPFAPVDPELSTTSGVGGSAGDYLRGAAIVASSVTGCPPVQAPEGGDVSATCRPEVTLTTNLGTVLKNVPVDFTVETGGGTVAPETNGVCGTYGSTVTVNTDANGKARVCWTLGTGANSVRARPRTGGDALDQTYFVPPSIVFNATANPPVGLAFVQQPGNTTAGSAISPAPTVSIQDLNGEQVPAATQQVSVTLSANSFTGTSTTQVNAVAGLATFSNLVITKAGTYTITASATLANGATTAISQSFTVSAAAAALTTTYMPPASPVSAQTFNYGNSLTPYVAVSPSPQVLVTDQYGNPVGAGIPLYWAATTSGGGSLTVGSGASTGANGTAQASSWVLGEGSNVLSASIYSDVQTPPAGYLPAIFNASTPTGQVIFACGVGSSKTDLGPITIPAPNSILKDITLQMSVTGQASVLSAYQANVSVRLDSYAGTELGTGSGTVQLPGNNGSPTPVTFHFAGSGIPRQTGNHVLWFRITFSNLPATRKMQVWYNASFANNSPCKDAKVYAPTYPTATTFKAGLSISATN